MENVFLRHATEEDAIFLLDLANEKECRNNSLNQNKISKESHEQWFKEILRSETCQQYIMVKGGESIGQGRLEQMGDGCRISYSLIPQRRGCGYGKFLLKLLNNAALTDFSSCIYTYGEVLQQNIASQKIFEELGYIAEKRDHILYYRKTIEYYIV